MTTINPQYITDKKGKKISVILKMKEYKWLLKKLENYAYLKLYYKGKLNNKITEKDFATYLQKRKTKKDK